MAVGYGHHDTYASLKASSHFRGCTKTLRYVAPESGEYTIRIATSDGNMQFLYVEDVVVG